MDLSRVAWAAPTMVSLLGLTCCASDTDPAAADAGQAASEGRDPDEMVAESHETDGRMTPEQVHCPADLEPFSTGSAGLSTSGEGSVLGVTVIAADPGAPERWLNDWEVQLTTAEGGPAPDAQVDFARPFMPIHGHDGGVLPLVESMGDGRFSLTGINFNMRGPWEVQLDVSSPTLGDDYIVVNVCVLE